MDIDKPLRQPRLASKHEFRLYRCEERKIGIFNHKQRKERPGTHEDGKTRGATWHYPGHGGEPIPSMRTSRAGEQGHVRWDRANSHHLDGRSNGHKADDHQELSLLVMA